MVERHGNVDAERALHRHGYLRGVLVLRAIDMGTEADARVIDLAQAGRDRNLERRHYPKGWALPSMNSMDTHRGAPRVRAPDARRGGRRSRAAICAGGGDLLRHQRLYRGEGTHGHGKPESEFARRYDAPRYGATKRPHPATSAVMKSASRPEHGLIARARHTPDAGRGCRLANAIEQHPGYVASHGPSCPSSPRPASVHGHATGAVPAGCGGADQPLLAFELVRGRGCRAPWR